MTPTPAHVEEAAVLLGFEGPGLRHILEAPRWCGDGNDGSCFAGECEHVENVQNVARALAEHDEAWQRRCDLYREAVTILIECDHGDENTCGCSDRAMTLLTEIKTLARPGVARVRQTASSNK